ncbi:hypothetical protein Hypma_000834 [Hypsizygus marmoreus]|uniref:GSKIP domain-containing protein n=1 Tax=Hypsizygus marmoreus TaxID=39966 RepID=A0A369JGQ0_HYPMA|nr:hypothetical protein Hypma_000834 [Hypsizygus marmoreus]
MCSSDSPTHFFADELRRALAEQSFGLQTFHITTTENLHAKASATLLEGDEITISLTIRGYSVESNKPTVLSNLDDTVFESVENLLQSVSPKYEMKRHERWVRKLEGLLSVE